MSFCENRNMMKDIKQSDGLKELLFFIFAGRDRIYRHKAVNKENKERKVLNAAVIVILLILLLSASGYPQNLVTSPLPTPLSRDLLFLLQRNADSNTVIYELNYNSNGTLNRKNPVKGSWIRYEEQGKFKELTSIERKFVYGVKCKALKNDQFEIRLVAFKKLPMYLIRSETDNKYKIYIKDEGKNLLLKRVFLRLNGGSFKSPKVEYIDLITTTSATGIEILKRISM